MRVGVFICHCGNNIAGTVDVKTVAEEIRKIPGVAHATTYMYTCSEPGQDEIKQAIKQYNLNRIVVAACSPRMHELTFRRTIEKAGLNKYYFEMANIREHISWVGENKEANTKKAIDVVTMAVAKVMQDRPLFSSSFKINKRVLVIGGGVAGMQAALDCGDGGLEIILVEKSPSVGGMMARLDKTFPTIDCSICILGPKMVDVAQHDKIKLYAYSEIEDIKGYVGNYQVKIRKKATYVDWTKCTGCGACMEKCPSKNAYDYFNFGVAPTKAINIPFPQAIPKKAKIDPNYCRHFTKGKCGVCAKICPTKAINYEMEDEIVTEEVGAIIAASGYSLLDLERLPEYGGGRYPDVISGIQYERLLNASGPTAGHILRPSDHTEPKTVVFVACAGSRDKSIGIPYCSNFCCMYIAKQAILTKDHIPDSQSYVFYMDIRSPGKGYDEFTRRAQEDYGVKYVRGRVSRIYPKGNKMVVRGADTLLGTQVEIEADLVVLGTAVLSNPDASRLAEKLHISYDTFGFYVESHPKLRPVETNTSGVFLAGACQGPKDIPASVSQGSAAASKVLALFSKDMLESDPAVARVDINKCVGCLKCVRTCPFQAIKEKELRDGRIVADVIETVCAGCGVCTSTCPCGAIQLQHFTDNQILAEVNAVCLG
ncbi:MAG: CoB--CoM heterodisulfide reductase iron-sulfur subunit A family protein [Syntrophorhabdaceae bacterium]|nr:CoB--CoM heterodisulfide reductase iron-sulfur subunit A family protein [Syntrophorhabdales bacterium]MBP9560522.1 CoB--CoM heterodisulfide reductase iron-sulfur subunit A family protein [Syntrophorhabdaceae bacterium]